MVIFLQKAWAFAKKYWQIFALALGAIIAAIVFREQSSSFVERLKDIQDAHDEEIKKIEAARAEERRQHEENEKKLRAALDAVQQQYDSAMKDLDDKKKKEIADLVKQYGDNPTELAKKLSAATGFSIILPS